MVETVKDGASPDLGDAETSVVWEPQTGKSLLSGPGGTFLTTTFCTAWMRDNICQQIKTVCHYVFMTLINWLCFFFFLNCSLCTEWELETAWKMEMFVFTETNTCWSSLVASEGVHSSSEQILITDSGGRERRKPVATYLMDEMLSFSVTDSLYLSDRQFRKHWSEATGHLKSQTEVWNVRRASDVQSGEAGGARPHLPSWKEKKKFNEKIN